LNLARELGVEHQDAEFSAFVQKETAGMESLRQSLNDKGGGFSAKKLAVLAVIGLGAAAFLASPAVAAPVALAAAHAASILSAGRLALWLLGGAVAAIGPGVLVQRLEDKGILKTGGRSVFAVAAGIPLAGVVLAGFLAGGWPAAMVIARGAGIGLVAGDWLANNPRVGDGIAYPLLLLGIYSGAVVAAQISGLLALAAGTWIAIGAAGIVALGLIARTKIMDRRKDEIEKRLIEAAQSGRVDPIDSKPSDATPFRPKVSPKETGSPINPIQLDAKNPLSLAGDYHAEEGPQRGTLHLEAVQLKDGIRLKGTIEASVPADGGGRSHEDTELWLARSPSNPWRWEGKITHETGYWEGPSDTSEDDVDAMGSSDRNESVAVTFSADGRVQIETEAQFMPFSGRRAADEPTNP
jgi:hypothetical protein